MPILNVKLNVPQAQIITKQVVTLLTDVTHNILKKRREVTVVQVEYIPPQQWFMGGNVLEGASYSLDIKVTSGTNTKDEMQSYLLAVFTGMEAIVGKVATASYSVIHEVRADSWGYGGSTQEFRYVSNQTK